MIYLVVDDTVITSDYEKGIKQLKQHLFTHFQTKDLGWLRYFRGIEVAQSKSRYRHFSEKINMP